jgi:hypothetical protein
MMNKKLSSFTLTQDPYLISKSKFGLGDLGVLRLALISLLNYMVPRIDS